MPRLLPAPLGQPALERIDADEILELLTCARNDRGPILERLREIRDLYNGDYATFLPDMDEQDRAAVPNLLNVGLDGHAQRIASTTPGVVFPDLDTDTGAARKRSRMRRDVVYGWWDASVLNLRAYRLARHYSGFGQMNLLVRPSNTLRAPKYEVRNPLNTYTVDDVDEDMAPSQVLYTSRRSGLWIAREYPDARARLEYIGGEHWSTLTWELVDYIDHRVLATICHLPGDQYRGREWQLKSKGNEAVPLDIVPNRVGLCPAITAGRFGLDRVVSQFEAMTGMYITQAQLQALEVIATRRDIFPDTYLEGAPGQNPQILVEADGVRGIIGRTVGGQLRSLTHPPGYQTNQTIDRLERNARVSGRIPPEFGGEGGTNIRTGRRGDSIMASTVDFGIQEAQKAMAVMIRKANELAIEVDLAYYGDTRKTYYVGGRNSRSKAEDHYTPNELWTTNRHDVTYAHPGSDTSQLTIAIMQRVGAGTMSKRTGMELDPMIDDPEKEMDRFTAEQLDAALLAAVGTQASQGAIPPSDVARIAQLVRTDQMDLADAIMQVQREAQERQAQQAPAQSPEVQPGLAQPGAGAEMATIPEPAAGSRNLLSLMSTARLPQMAVAGEAGNVAQIDGLQGIQ